MNDSESQKTSKTLRDALLSEDDIGKVVRVHINVESVVRKFIEISVKHPAHIKPMELDYFGAVHLALATGLTEDLKKPLLQIGKLRNRFAHKLNQSLDKDSMNNLYDSFSANRKSEMLSICSESALSWGQGKSINWKDATPQDQFVVMATSLYWMLKIDLTKFSHGLKLQVLERHLAQLTIDRENG